MLFFKTPSTAPAHININSLQSIFYFTTAIIAFIADLVFRKFIPLLRKLWVVEGLLIVFTLVLMLILRSTTT
ncbi:hypothetical protein LPB86_09640 [Pedobacter sp. MC2016-14]|uniref:hypothetical protein n=1 Tax=Pedobacter sp. MC2016-14 TaxID=2897327 RepID=UPI001E2F8137|nr:hypothetical protein [Pedobacter sp. MC2016-14]MCD0488493.1 hypothetical protein [Pedobacter sp. MC2016-14]